MCLSLIFAHNVCVYHHVLTKRSGALFAKHPVVRDCSLVCPLCVCLGELMNVQQWFKLRANSWDRPQVR